MWFHALVNGVLDSASAPVTVQPAKLTLTATSDQIHPEDIVTFTAGASPATALLQGPEWTWVPDPVPATASMGPGAPAKPSLAIGRPSLDVSRSTSVRRHQHRATRGKTRAYAPSRSPGRCTRGLIYSKTRIPKARYYIQGGGPFESRDEQIAITDGFTDSWKAGVSLSVPTSWASPLVN